MKVFFDTSAFVALHDRSDSFHSQAKRFYEDLTSEDRLFTSNYVVDETITRLRYAVGHSAAAAFGDAVTAGRLFSIFYIDAELEKLALSVLKKYADKKLSFTDCSTIALRAEHGLDAIFAFDDDFAKVGLRVVPAS